MLGKGLAGCCSADRVYTLKWLPGTVTSHKEIRSWLCYPINQSYSPSHNASLVSTRVKQHFLTFFPGCLRTWFMPGAPVVCPPGQTPLLNTLLGRPAEREARSSALLLAARWRFLCFSQRRRPRISSASWFLLETNRKENKKKSNARML